MHNFPNSVQQDKTAYKELYIYTVYHYSWLSLYRPRLSRITAYLEVKIWSLPKHENLTTGKNILWKRGEIAPKEQFLLFSTILSIHLKLQYSNYTYIC